MKVTLEIIREVCILFITGMGVWTRMGSETIKPFTVEVNRLINSVSKSWSLLKRESSVNGYGPL